MINGQLSNCMNCHKRSTFPGFARNDMRGVPWRGDLDSGADCFSHQIRLDYVRTLSPLDPQSDLGKLYFSLVGIVANSHGPSLFEFH